MGRQREIDVERTPEDEARERAEMEVYCAPETVERERARDEDRRGDLLPILQIAPPWMATLRKLEEDGRQLRATTCGGCDSATCATAKGCQSRGSELEVDGTPLCRWVREVRLENVDRERTEMRIARLKRARYTRQNVIDLIAPSYAPPKPLNRRPSEAFLTMWRAVERFRQDQSLTLLGLFGAAGTGKSTAAAWLAASIEGTTVIRPDDIDITDEWKQHKVRAMAASLVIVEELGLGYQEGTGWRAREIEKVICRRYDEGKRTVCIGNINEAMLLDIHGARVQTRLMDRDGGCIWVMCGRKEDNLRSHLGAA